MTCEFWHVGFTVTDLPRSAAFYRDVAGMEEGEHMKSTSEAFAKLVNNPGCTLNAVFLRNGAFTMQLLQYLTKGGEKLVVAHNHIGSPHLSFYVADAQVHYDMLHARGDVEITSDIITNPRGTIRSFYVNDPDGIPVEFVERLQRLF